MSSKPARKTLRAKATRGKATLLTSPPVDAESYKPIIQALRSIKQVLPFTSFDLPTHQGPLLRVSTMDEYLGWPLCNHQAYEVMATYMETKGVAIVPAAQLTIESDNWKRSLNDDVLPRLITGLQVYAPVSLYLSHLALDSIGSTDALVPATSRPNSFGSIAILLPTTYSGGAVTCREGMSSNTIWGDAPALTRTHCAAMAATTTVTVAPITSGRRAVLVYHLVYDSPVESPQSVISSSIDALRGLAAKLRHKHNLIGCVLERNALDALSHGDNRFARALMTSGAYDAVLVEYTTHCCHHVVASTYAPAPGMQLPFSLLESVLSMKPEVSISIGHATAGPDCCSMLFWLKAHRHRVVSLLPALKYAVHGRRSACSVDELPSTVDGLPFDADTTDALLGQASPTALLETLLPRFADAEEQGTTNSYTESVVACFKALLRLGRLDLVQRFVGMYLCVDSDYDHDTAVGPWIHRCLETFGWEPLASAIYSMLRRWRSTKLGVSWGYCLVVDLAGVTEAPVCLPLLQPFATECITEMWTLLAEGAPLFADFEVTPWYNVMTIDICRQSLQLEVHAATASVADRWLYNRLPDLIVAKVASYLGPANHVQRLADMNVFHPVFDMALGVVALLAKRQNDVAQRFLPSVFEGMDHSGDHATYTVDVAYSLLVLAAFEGDDGRWRSTLSKCGNELGIGMAPALISFTEQWPQLATAPIIDTCVAALLHHATESIEPVSTVLGHYEPDVTLDRMSPTSLMLLDALYFISEHSATEAEAVARRVAAHLTDPDDAREILYPVVVHMDKASPAFAWLANAFLDTLSYLRHGDNHYALPFLTHETADCCDQYAAVAAFLLAPDVAELQLPAASCVRIHALVRRCPGHLRWESTDDDVANEASRLVKRRPPHHRGPPEAHLVEAYTRDAKMAATVHALLEDNMYAIRHLFHDA
ncbi:hypothetical protein SPRG_00304 [Saprolegnia parasitica CBS 223.65]|uniref:Uncharacterized protein n=1 Tax=Saprolegnia parasitica (strain CBS 223.65) TaxID=695850 RepID=A0A067D8X0_SAPPC|nr:hypothetical protein SPRG_00304 [Saprolegnia parasitica CBS 223.65]KDO35457.1 hypothetical protein SPRG_00304 [Saprolegnia parasitica CBS 223.65]|eukprot:XP_012193796.1 hypothetical protein SPRG_00304 [Saprolegnia parasitica CBS 223.65]